VTIPKGVDSGVNLRMSKKGNFSLKGEPGDLLIKVTVKPHPLFKREGSDIVTDREITFSQAALGAAIKIDTLWGKQEVKIRPGTGPDETITLAGMGVPKLPPNQTQKGNHLVKIKLVVPKKLSEAQRQALE
jgi:molecular chaperone DnaJ